MPKKKDGEMKDYDADLDDLEEGAEEEEDLDEELMEEDEEEDLDGGME